jgi:serine protease Do
LPSNAIKKLRDDFLSRGHARYGWTGLSVVDQTFKLDEHGQTEKRPVVTAIAPDSPAAKSDLRVGDVILNLDGKAIKNSAEIPSTTFFKREGDELLLRIQRGGATKLLSLHLGARPATFVPFQPREPLPQVPQLAPLTPPLPTILPASATVSK